MNEMKIDFAVGGQAVLEGVMMRSPNYYTVSVRDTDGSIKMMQSKFESRAKKGLFRLPIIRGSVQLVESMIIGFRALDFSSNVFSGEEKVEYTGWKKYVFGVFSVLYVMATLSLTLFMLKFIPLWIAQKSSELLPIVKNYYILFNAIDGLSKIAIFLGYVLAISILKDIKRVFQYHGAEHMSVWTYEKGLELTVDNARKQTRFHPRCGTSFIFIVIIMSVLVYTFLPKSESFAFNFFARIASLPLIAGISYEFLKFSAKYEKNAFIKLFVLPGLLIQRLTTKEPDDKQLEIALNSLKESLKIERLAPELAVN